MKLRCTIASLIFLLLGAASLAAQETEAERQDSEQLAPMGVDRTPEPFVASLEYVEDSELVTLDDTRLSQPYGTIIDSIVHAGTLGLNYCNDLSIHSGALRVALDLGETYNYGAQAFTVDVSLKLEGVDKTGGTETILLTRDPIALSINPDRPEQVWYVPLTGTDLSNHDLIDVYRITINSYIVTGGVNPDIRVTVSYDDDYSVNPIRSSPDEDESMLYYLAKHEHLSVNPVAFEWEIDGFCSERFPAYQLQVLRVYNTKKEYNDDPVKVHGIVDWAEALTVEVAGTDSPVQSVALTLAEGTGWYVWRVRPIGSLHPGGAGDGRNWGVWSDAPADGDVIDATSINNAGGNEFYDSCGFYLTQPEDTLNWTYGRGLTEGEEGVGTRYAETMTFLTPMARPAQVQVRVAEDGTYLTANSTVDFQGRSTLAQMTAPVGTPAEGFTFRRDHFNLTAVTPYSAAYFDDDDVIDDPWEVNETPGSASEYYNGTTNESGSQVPTVDRYPFTRTILTTDGSGRVDEIGGIGDVFRIGGEGANKSRTVKIRYASASETELVRLFGDEAPADSNVYRVMVTNQNKVTSVRWVSGGRTIATGYERAMGDTIMLPLTHTSEPRLTGTVSDTLRGNRTRGRHGSSAIKRYAFSDSTDISVRYTITPDTLRALGDCFDTCATCDYRVRLYVHHLDELDSTEVLEYNLGADPCGTGQAIDTTISLTLGPGTYAIERRIQSNIIDSTTVDANNPYGRTYAEQFRELVGGIMRDSILADDSLEQVMNHLDNGHLDSVYLYLGLDLDSLANFESYTITTECCTITLPILDPNCGFDPCRGGDPDFEQALFDKWGNKHGTDLNDYFKFDGNENVWVADSYKPTKPFNQLIANMLADTDTAGNPLYDCAELWTIWVGIIGGFERLKVDPDNPSGFNPDFNMLDMFLQAVGRYPIDTAQTPYGTGGGKGYLSKAHRYINGDAVTSSQGCTTRVDYDPGWHDEIDSTRRWLELYSCWTGKNRENKNEKIKRYGADCDLSDTLNGVPTGEATWHLMSAADQLDSCYVFTTRRFQEDCRSTCERRAGEVYHEILAAYAVAGVTISSETAACAAEQWIDSCLSGCELTEFGSAPIDSIGTPAEWQLIENVFTASIEVEPPIVNGSGDTVCASDSLTMTPDGSFPYLDIIVPHLNGRLHEYWRRHGGTQWHGFMDALREVAPAWIVATITDSTIFVPPFSTEAEPPVFEIRDTCKLWYSADTVYWLDMSDGVEHPWVTELNRLLDDRWGVPIDTGSAPDADYVVGRVTATAADTLGIRRIVADTIRPGSILQASSVNGPLVNGVVTATSIGELLLFDDQHEHAIFPSPYDEDGHRITDIAISCVDTTEPDILHFSQDTFTYGASSQFDNFFTYRIDLGPDFSQVVAFAGCDVTFGPDPVDGIDTIMADLTLSQGCRVSPESLERLVERPFTDVIGRFDIDSSGYLRFIFRNWGRGETLLDTVVYEKIRFFGAVTRKLSDNVCGDFTCTGICWRWIPAPPIDTVASVVAAPPPCEETAIRRIRSEINRSINRCVDDEVFRLAELYDEKCGNPDSLDENIVVEYDVDYIHFTLYYYDRAGNLVRTVPAKGVDVLPPNATRGSPTNHTFITEYDYDSEGRLVRAKSPDGGESRVWYDELGRLRFSQDARLAARGEYAYTKFDTLGRPVESGVSTEQFIAEAFADSANINDRLFPTIGTERTYVAYDTTSGVTYLDGSPQRNIRNRVSRSWTDDDAATHFSYDEHGNVEWVAQEVPGLARSIDPATDPYQYLRYDYQLISGNVDQVVYNEGRVDEFRHRYDYDADNVLRQVETSQDSVVWDRDARYEYYRHGPLRRIELGEDHVQGLDYTWTADGRLKAINHPSLVVGDDPGKDGTSTYGHEEFAADSFAILMHYHPFDYMAQGAGVPFRSYQTSGGLQEGNDLLPTPHYDGNISSVESHIGKITGDTTTHYEERTGTSYRYDLLGRLDSSRFHTFDTFNDEWNDFGQEYLTTYEYDANGNIVSLLRHAADSANGTLMDELSYTYVAGESNRIDWVGDAVAGDDYSQDIENTQSSDNYEYDEIGNLVEDFDEGGMTMTWESGGRLKSVDHGLIGGTATAIDYVYDASGARTKKIVTRATGPIITTVTTYYVNDAAGTVVAIYEEECEVSTAPDVDKDGIPDGSDNCPTTFNPQQYDFDGDGIGDACDADIDNDGTPNGSDLCPWDPLNGCPPGDRDSDGLATGIDHCPNTFDTLNIDTDGDGLGDACDPDIDNDGIPNDHDPCPFDAYETDCPDCETRLVELPIYGLSRVGVYRPDITLDSIPSTDPIYTREVGRKSYELTDHLGNVRGVVTDRKLAGTPGSGDYYAEYQGYTNPYPYGMPQPGRNWSADSLYRYGFNGMETDPEIKEESGHHMTTYFRQYDSRLGRWWSNDPITHSWESPYSAMYGNPVRLADPLGAEGYEPTGSLSMPPPKPPEEEEAEEGSDPDVPTISAPPEYEPDSDLRGRASPNALPSGNHPAVEYARANADVYYDESQGFLYIEQAGPNTEGEYVFTRPITRSSGIKIPGGATDLMFAMGSTVSITVDGKARFIRLSGLMPLLAFRAPSGVLYFARFQEVEDDQSSIFAPTPGVEENWKFAGYYDSDGREYPTESNTRSTHSESWIMQRHAQIWKQARTTEPARSDDGGTLQVASQAAGAAGLVTPLIPETMSPRPSPATFARFRMAGGLLGTLGIALDILDDGFEPVHILDGIATVGTFSGTGTVPGLVWGVSRMTWLTSDMVNGVFDWFGLNF